MTDETAQKIFPYERDYIRAHWLLGAALRVNGQLAESQQHLDEALERCRKINLVEMEGDILIELAHLRADLNDHAEARRLAEEALHIAARCEYVLQMADAHLALARLDEAAGDAKAALQHAREAHRLATCDGPPDYTYKAAYVEAEAFIERLKAKG